MATPTPSALSAGFITIATLGAVAGMTGTVKKHAYVSNDTKAEIETAGYFNPVADLLTKGDMIEVSGDRDGTPFVSIYVVTDPAADVTLTEQAAITSNPQAVLNIDAVALDGTDTYRVVAPFAGTVEKIYSVIDGALTTGDATLTGKIGGSAITDGVVTIAQAGSAAGDVDVATPSAAKAFVAGDTLEVTVGGSNDAAQNARVTFLCSAT